MRTDRKAHHNHIIIKSTSMRYSEQGYLNITTILMIRFIVRVDWKISLDLTLAKLLPDFLLRMNNITQEG